MPGTYEDTPNLKYKDFNRGASHYEIFEFTGRFCHESKHSSATPQLAEVLGSMNDCSTPERIMVEVRAREAEQTFTAFVELKLIRFEDHYYERTDDESEERNRKDAKKNQKFLGHLQQYAPPKTSKPAAKPKRLEPLTAAESEWA